jgi:hypothetical protein
MISKTEKGLVAGFLMKTGVLIVFIGLGVIGLQWWWLLTEAYWTPLPLRIVWQNAGLLLPHVQWPSVQSIIAYLFDAPVSVCIIGIGLFLIVVGRMFEGNRSPCYFEMTSVTVSPARARNPIRPAYRKKSPAEAGLSW